jgi:hypothetical protein
MNKKSTNIKQEQAKRNSLLCRWLMAVAAVLLLLDVFAPGVNWILSAAVRKNPVRNGHVEVVVPRSWLVLNLVGDMISAVPGGCITRFCSTSSATFSWSRPLPGSFEATKRATFKAATIKALEEDGFANPVLRRFDGAAGSFECVEGLKPAPAHTASVWCQASSATIMAVYQGDPAHVNSFYALARSVRSH